jgi:protein SCO1/2
MKFGLFLIAALVQLSCQTESAPPLPEGPVRGGQVNPSIPKPSFTLPATDGTAFDFRAETDGFVTLLFFGYTSCPDICPLHMARIGAAMKELDTRVTERVKVVFVSTDPERDTPERIRNWLDAFHSDFIGIRGELDEINALISGIRFAPARREELEDGAYGVSHPSGVIAYTPDNQGRFLYLGGLGGSKEDWLHDLPILAFRDFGAQ